MDLWIKKSKTLYHYTNMHSALSILTKATLRFSDVRYCNDPDEIDSGLSILNKVHDEIFSFYLEKSKKFAFVMSFIVHSLNLVTSFDNNEEDLLEKIKNDVMNLELNFSDFAYTKSPIYVACFSEKSDDLRQWVPYANDGRGVAIGFKGLDETHNITDENIWLLKVCYKSVGEKEQYVRNVYIELFKIFEHVPISLFGNFVASIYIAFLHDVIACKSENYKDEEEWRLFFTCLNVGDEEDIQFQVREEIIKPYINMQIIKDSVLDLKLGPKSEKNLNEHALYKVKNKFAYKNAKITKSSVSYR